MDVIKELALLMQRLDGVAMIASPAALYQAADPWRTVRSQLGLMGYPTAYEYEAAIKKAIVAQIVEAL